MSVVTVSSKIPQSWLQLITAKGKPSAVVRLALEQYLGVSDDVPKVNQEGIQEVNPLQLDLLAIQARLDNLEKFVGYTKVYPESEKGILEPQKGIPESLPAFTQQPIAISSPPPPIEVPTIITESPVQPELQPIGKVENNAIMTKAKAKTQSQPELQPIEVDQDATTAAAPIGETQVTWYTTTQVLPLLQARGYQKKTIQSLRRDLRPSIEARQLSSEFLAFGLVADFEARLSFESKINKALWLSLEPIA